MISRWLLTLPSKLVANMYEFVHSHSTEVWVGVIDAASCLLSYTKYVFVRIAYNCLNYCINLVENSNS